MVPSDLHDNYFLGRALAESTTEERANRRDWHTVFVAATAALVEDTAADCATLRDQAAFNVCAAILEGYEWAYSGDGTIVACRVTSHGVSLILTNSKIVCGIWRTKSNLPCQFVSCLYRPTTHVS